VSRPLYKVSEIQRHAMRRTGKRNAVPKESAARQTWDYRGYLALAKGILKRRQSKPGPSCKDGQRKCVAGLVNQVANLESGWCLWSEISHSHPSFSLIGSTATVRFVFSLNRPQLFIISIMVAPRSRTVLFYWSFDSSPSLRT
jgi:hypothetical protein